MELAENCDFEVVGVVVVRKEVEGHGEVGARIGDIRPVAAHACVEGLLGFTNVNFATALANDCVGNIFGRTGEAVLDEVGFFWTYHFVGEEGQLAGFAALVVARFGAYPLWWEEGWEGAVDEGVFDVSIPSVADQRGVLKYISIFVSVLEEVKVRQEYFADGVVVWVVCEDELDTLRRICGG